MNSDPADLKAKICCDEIANRRELPARGIRVSCRWCLLLMPALIMAVAFAWFESSPATEQPKRTASNLAPPEYDEDGHLVRPTLYEKWVVVGTSVGLDYSDGSRRDPTNPGTIHNVYVQPEAFDHYVKTGEFPEQTMFIVTNNRSQPAKTKGEPSRAGYVAAPTSGLEISIKDSQRYPNGWGYFMFEGPADPPGADERQVAKVLAADACFECHAEHGAVDSVFTQYYSVLSEARERFLAKPF